MKVIQDGLSMIDPKIVINISGEAGSGKSHSALAVARGLVNHPSEVLLIDTEDKGFCMANHPDYVDGRFKYLQYPPNEDFGIDQLIQAVQMGKESGAKVCVIDSFSSIYSDKGGMKDVVAKSKGTKYAWSLVDDWVKKVRVAFASGGMHLVLTTRSKSYTENGSTLHKVEMKSGFSFLYHIDVVLQNRRASIQRDNLGLVKDRIDRSLGERILSIRTLQTQIDAAANELYLLLAGNPNLDKAREWVEKNGITHATLDGIKSMISKAK